MLQIFSEAYRIDFRESLMKLEKEDLVSRIASFLPPGRLKTRSKKKGYEMMALEFSGYACR